MNSFKKILLLLFTMIMYTNILMGNEGEHISNKDFDIRYTKEDIIKVVDSLNLNPPKIDNCDIKQIIFLVKVYNTIGKYITYLNKNESMLNFAEYFLSNYCEKAACCLSASLTRGFGYYSKNYDIYIGGSHINDKSFFYIEELDKLDKVSD